MKIRKGVHVCVREIYKRRKKWLVREKDSETCQIYSADLCYHCCVARILTSCMHRCRNMCVTVTSSFCFRKRERSRYREIVIDRNEELVYMSTCTPNTLSVTC